MSRYDALTAMLLSRSEPRIVLSFDELDSIVGGLPDSARTYGAWWANKRSSQPHAKAWLDAGRRAAPEFREKRAVFTQDPSVLEEMETSETPTEGQEVLAEYVESTISFERDLEDHLIHNLPALEAGLTLIARQETIAVGRIDILARGADGETVIIEIKVGEAKDSAIGQIARYVGWYARAESRRPRSILIAGSFSEPTKYGAAAIQGLRLVTYQVSFSFSDASL
jgi:hypothetical protein